MGGGRMTAHRVGVPQFLVRDITQSYTVNANSGSGAVDFPCALSGYTFLGVVGVASGSQQVCTVQFKKFDDSKARAYFRNVSNSNYTPTGIVTCLYVKN